MVEKIFYHSSLPRAGSTLLQNILAQNPDFHVTPASGVIDLILGARTNYTNSPEFNTQEPETVEKGFIGFCKEGLNGYYNSITDKKYVIDKNRAWAINYDLLNLINPQPKIIFMIRDLRDVFASLEKNFRANPDKQNPILDPSTMQGTTVPKRIDIWSQNPPLGLAIERLTEILRLGLTEKIHFVKYEDLCLYPEVTLRELYEYLELPYFKHDIENIAQVTKEDDEIYGVLGDYKTRNKLEYHRSNANQILGKDITKWIWENYSWYYQQFRYTK